MTYDSTLPMVFPFKAEVTVMQAHSIASMLIERDQPMSDGIQPPAGSSFAITANLYDYDKRIMWLSHVSYDRVRTSQAIVARGIDWAETGRGE
jgi:hypothetical protein